MSRLIALIPAVNLLKYVRRILDWSWMTVTLCRVGINFLRDSFIQPSQPRWLVVKLVGETDRSPNFKTHRSRTWDLNQALDTVQRENQGDQSSNQRIFFYMVHILNLAGYFKPAIRLRHKAV